MQKWLPIRRIIIIIIITFGVTQPGNLPKMLGTSSLGDRHDEHQLGHSTITCHPWMVSVEYFKF